MMISAVSQNGTCRPSKIASCRIFTTKYNRAVAPSVRDRMKNAAPVL